MSTLEETYKRLHESYNPKVMPRPTTVNHGYNLSNPKQLAVRNLLVKESENLRENCSKRILLDIYMKVLPFDDGYAAGNRGTCQSDVDAYLANKKMTGVQYFQSAYERTKAPLLEYVIRSIDDLCKAYVEEGQEKAKEAEEAGIDPPEPAEMEEEEVDSQLVDVEKDDEYEDFIEELKKKTVNKIVDDISALIQGNQEEKDMTFDPQSASPEFGESGNILRRRKRLQEYKRENTPIAIPMDYMSKKALTENTELGLEDDQFFGMAIKEFTFHVLDNVFEMDGKKPEHFANKIRLGNGVIVHQESVQVLLEAHQSLWSH